ncbi:hypothetical protein EKM01_12875 [Flavobacterium sp. RSP46]|uniref:hypothetical protein n=1 Tax=Flavobacterium sp. RSP46 TaxID=2497486 RepID=UPI000F87A69F|nr:hypothetical protein [Flavobacterium sp. RSP46]RTY89997.1 hypothetical protein EKM01_12875 [Flavobacterium sp. RSP46]
MKKTIILILIILSTNFILSQEKIEDKTYDDFFKAHEALSKNPNAAYGKGRINAPQAPLFRGENTGLGNSKYDKDIIWDADIDPNDVQGSIKRFRDGKRQEEAAVVAKYVGIGIAFILLVFLLRYFIIRDNKDEDEENMINEEIPHKICKNQKTNKNSFVNSVIEKEESYLEKNEGKIEVEILESQITFLNEIITNRNGKAVCEKLKENLKGAKTKKMLPEESFEIINKKAVIKRVTKLMLTGINEETALLKTKIDLMEELNKKTNETIEDLLNNFYNS